MIELPTCVTRVELSPGYPVLEVNHPSARARVALNGGHIMEWTPTGEAPVLYMSPDAEFQAGKPIRGGIPICWPWFGPHPTRANAPATAPAAGSTGPRRRQRQGGGPSTIPSSPP